MQLDKVRAWVASLIVLMAVLLPVDALAQAGRAQQQVGNCMGGQMGCGMMSGGWMATGMIFAWLFGLALIVALVALAVFLFRHSRPTRPA